MRLANGLVRVTNVPQIGGRTLDYRLGDYNFLFIGRQELGATHDDEPTSYRYYGGHFAQLHPSARWRGLQAHSPTRLLMGRYDARLVAEAGPTAVVEMTAPHDLATGTRIVRRIELFAGSTRVRLTDTLANGRLVPQQRGIHDILQLKGYPTRSGVLRGGERPQGHLGLYVPLNPQSRYPGGVRRLTADEQPARGRPSQWSTSRLPGLLTLRYDRRVSKVLADPDLPWVAFVDHRSDYVFVQSCRVARKAFLTAGAALRSYPFIELQCFGPVATLGPGESITLVQEWCAARCPGPVVDVTDAGVVSSPLTLLRGEGATWAAGTFGVFCVGTAAAVFRGADGTELARVDCGAVHPHCPFVLNRAVDVPPATAQVVLEVRDAAGKPVGDLGTIVLGTK